MNTNITEEKSLNYCERLILELQTAGCPTIYTNLVQKFMKDEHDKKELYAAENRGVLTFGKYKNKDVKEVYKLDPTYCQWLNDKSSKFLRADIKEVLAELLK
jgi:hypothetical protein